MPFLGVARRGTTGQRRSIVVADETGEPIEQLGQGPGLAAHPPTIPDTKGAVHRSQRPQTYNEPGTRGTAFDARPEYRHGRDAAAGDRCRRQDTAVEAGELRDLEASLPTARAHVDLEPRLLLEEPTPSFPGEQLTQRLIDLPGAADRVADLLQQDPAQRVHERAAGPRRMQDDEELARHIHVLGLRHVHLG